MSDFGLTPARRRLFLVLLGLVAYAPVLKVPFIWDDHTMIETNPRIRAWSWAAIRHDFTSDVFEGHGDAYYRPAQTESDRIDYSIWRLHPFGYHLTNLLAHIANALLLEALLILMGLPLLTAFICASLFVVSPIGVEQLIIVAGRAELLGLTFGLLSLIFLAKRSSWKNALAAYAFFAVALLFKESAVVTPVLGALVLWQERRPRRDYAVLLGYAALLPFYFLLRQHAVGPLPRINGSTLGLFTRMVFPFVLWRYAALILVPWNLHSHRLMPHIQSGWWWQWLALLAIAGAILRRRDRWLAFAFVWYVVCLAPKAPIMITGNFMLDHWAYPASVGIFLPVAILFHYGWTHPEKPGRNHLSILYLIMLIAYALLVRLNIELRGTDEKIYRWALSFTTSNPIKHNLGLYLVEHQRPMEGIPFLEDYRAAYPDDADNLYILAKAYYTAGYPKTAVMLLQDLLKKHPAYGMARRTLETIIPKR